MPTLDPKPGSDVAARAPSSIVICGKGRIATAALSFTVHYVAARRLPSRVAASANRDDPGRDTWQPSLLHSAERLGVPSVELADVESEPDLLLVSLEYDRLIRVERFASKRLFNIHFSALPRYRGVLTSIWPILNRESSVGVTLHYMSPRVDAGAIVAQAQSPLRSYMTSRQLYEVYLDEGLSLFQCWLPRLIDTLPAGTDQDEAQATLYTRKSMDPRQTEVDLSQDSATVVSFVRALSFPEYQLATVSGRSVRACAVIPGVTNESPGTALRETTHSTSVAVGDGGIVEFTWA